MKPEITKVIIHDKAYNIRPRRFIPLCKQAGEVQQPCLCCLRVKPMWNQTSGVHAEDAADLRILNEIRSRPMLFRRFAEFLDDYNAGTGGT